MIERDKDGKIIKSTGRPKGARNKTPADLQKAVLQLVNSSMPQLKKDLKSLKPASRARLMIDLLKTVLPKDSNININNLSDETVNEVYSRLINNIADE